MRIALIHAVEVAMPPVREAFARLWPEADCLSLLDDRLSVDRAMQGALTAAMTDRILALARYAHQGDADAILFTCSAFGPAIEAAADLLPIPVLKPNQAMFDTALKGSGPIGLLASFAPSLAPMQAEFQDLCRARNVQIDLIADCAPEAMRALQAGDGARHDALLADQATRLAACKQIMLAQFSTARAAPSVAAATGRPVLTSPESAVLDLRARLEP